MQDTIYLCVYTTHNISGCEWRSLCGICMQLALSCKTNGSMESIIFYLYRTGMRERPCMDACCLVAYVLRCGRWGFVHIAQCGGICDRVTTAICHT